MTALDSPPKATSASRWLRVRTPLVVGASVAAASLLVVVVDPNEPGHYPACPTKVVSGLDCPFCGGMRCAHSLLTGDVEGAVDHNALVVALAPIAAVAWVLWLWFRWTNRPLPSLSTRSRRVAIWLVVAVLVAWTVWRNVPAGSYFASGLA